MQRSTSEDRVVLLAVGDMVLGFPDMGKYFEAAAPILKSGDITMGQIEAPHTNRGQWSSIESRSLPASKPEWLDDVAKAGFNVATTAGNHTFDQGYYGVVDTLEKLHSLGIQTTGTGENLDEARKPMLYEKNGIKIAIIQCTCLGPDYSWATPTKAGANYIRVITAYGTEMAEPGAMPEQVWTFPDPGTMNAFCRQIDDLKDEGYFVVAALHIGNMFTKALLPYDLEICHRVIEAGADAVLSCHAHELRGITTYKGKPIFHGLGNFVAFSNNQKSSSAHERLYRFRPHAWPGVQPTGWDLSGNAGGTVLEASKAKIPNYIFSDDSRNTLIAKLVFGRAGIESVSFYPCYIEDDGVTVPVNRDGKGSDVLEHIQMLNEIEGLKACFEWSEDGKEVYLRIKKQGV